VRAVPSPFDRLRDLRHRERSSLRLSKALPEALEGAP